MNQNSSESTGQMMFKFDHLPDPDEQASIYGLVKNIVKEEAVEGSCEPNVDSTTPESPAVRRDTE